MRSWWPDGASSFRGHALFLAGAVLLVTACGEGGSARPPCLTLEPAADLTGGGAAGPPSAGRMNGAYPEFRAVPDPHAPGALIGAADALGGYVARVMEERGQPFDWNRAADAALCAAIDLGAGPLVVGVSAARGDDRHQALDELVHSLEVALGHPPAVSSRSDRLGTLRITLGSCLDLAAIRALPRVAFVEVEYGLVANRRPLASDAKTAAADAAPREDEPANPGLYDPAESTHPSYATFMEQVDADAAARMRRQHMDAVYDELGFFGDSSVGVAVLDNGVLADWEPFLSTGRGRYRTAGFLPPQIGETHPLPDDFLGIAPVFPNVPDHGTRQSRHVQSFAPQADRATVRSSSFPLILLPNDFAGVTNALLAMADDDDVRVVSMSLGTIIHSHEVELAVDELHARGKILVAAAGTSLPIIRDLVGVVFPATMPIVISATGLTDTESTGGTFKLGASSHGGPENDFVIEPSPASSEAVSTLAGMIATLWSIDSEQSRESVVDALIRSSNYYQESRAKDPLFGWGRIDAFEAALTIQQGGCAVENR